MQTAINGHPSNARKSQRVTCIHRLVRRCAIILGTLSGVLPGFWVPFSAIQFGTNNTFSVDHVISAKGLS